MKTTIKLISKAGKVKWYYAGTIKRFIYRLTHDKFSKAIVRVEYGKQKDHTGKMVMFYNEGEYDNGRDAKHALRAFCEK